MVNVISCYKGRGGRAEMVQWLRALVTIPEDLGLIPLHLHDRSKLSLTAVFRESSAPFWVPQAPCAMRYMYIHTGKPPIHIKEIQSSVKESDVSLCG